ncbi:hypothetical protein SRB17_63590 [Streptomyces sp. RB17]|nr:hypothetical protein [Streptomyces sp. RB17]MQY38346.1 hypothetical protein [Streptomyces sp. RB17]
MNIALPHIQDALKFSTTDLTWVVSAYTLTFKSDLDSLAGVSGPGIG